jgi:putative ABC transport system permease protein
MPTPNDPLQLLPRRHRLLLRLLPAHVRAEHARELHDELAGRPVPLRSLALDLLRASPAAHWDVLRQDLTLAVRQFWRTPAFAFIACLTLAIGIGGNVAFFTLVDGVLLRQLPMAGSERVVDITEENPGRGLRTFGISPANFRDFTRDRGLFQAAAAWNSRSGTLRLGEERQRVVFAAVGGEFFRVFTEQPLLGRTLVPEDDVPGGASAVVSWEFWQGTLGADTAIVGRELEIDGVRLRVVGVMPARFTFPSTSTVLWRPLALPESEWEPRGSRSIAAIARLQPDVPVSQAAATLTATARALAAEFPKTNGGWTVLVRTLQAARVDGVRVPLLLAWGAGALVLLIAVANVASLFLARAVSRQRELALRAALGARAGRVARQLLTEGLVVTLLGATAGLGIAQALLTWLRPPATSAIPRMNEVAIGPRAMAWTLLLVALTTALLSVLAGAPARGRRLRDALGTIRSGTSRHRRRLQSTLVAGEVALAVFVLIGGALVIRTLVGILAQPRGYESRALLTFRVEPPWHLQLDAPMEQLVPALQRERERAGEAYHALLTRLTALPGVTRAGAINRLPLTGDWWTTSVRLPERPADDETSRMPVLVRPVTPGYVEAMGTRLLRGRGVRRTDVAGGELVVVIDAEFARRIWGDVEPLGREVLLDGPPGQPSPRARVVGVVEPVHMNQLDADLRPTMYVPFAQAMEGHYLNWGMDVVVRGASRQLEPQLRAAVHDVFPDAAIFRVRMMDEVVAASTATRRFQLVVLALFGALALLLATVGVGGALLLAVRERRSEIAVQMALGARPGRLWWAVQRAALGVAGTGALVGFAGAVAGARLFSSVVYGVSVRDPVALLAGPTVMLIAAFAAAAIPATRAVRASPVNALRD